MWLYFALFVYLKHDVIVGCSLRIARFKQALSDHIKLFLHNFGKDDDITHPLAAARSRQCPDHA